jgi:hypothetical protein
MRYASPVRWEGQSLLCPYPYRAPKDPSRRVRYDRAQLIPEVFLVESASRRTTPIVAARNGVAMSQAIRARLRSHDPSGTKTIRPSGGLALS